MIKLNSEFLNPHTQYDVTNDYNDCEQSKPNSIEWAPQGYR